MESLGGLSSNSGPIVCYLGELNLFGPHFLNLLNEENSCLTGLFVDMSSIKAYQVEHLACNGISENVDLFSPSNIR